MEENNVNSHLVKFFVTCLSAVFALGLSAVTVLAEEFDPNPVSPQITAENVAAFFDTAFDVQRQDHELAGAVVSVVYRGEVLFKRGYGWADLEKRVPADPDRSLFRIASISKTFVWTAIMQLDEQDRLDLEDDVNTYIDFQIPATFEEPIRIKHLLTHTPGFEEKGTGGSTETVDDLMPLGEYLATVIPARVRPPGEHASYSNFGAALAGYIVERISGQTWADYVDEHILKPLQMNSTNTQDQLNVDFAERHAVSYTYQAGRFKSTDFEFMNKSPAGNMSTTADDMTRFMLAHLSHGEYGGVRILSEATARLMQTPLFAPHEGIAPMLHGFYRSDRNGQLILGHGGDTNQFHSNMSLIPGHELGVFVSFNTDPGSRARSNLIVAFINHFFPVDYLRTAPEAAEVNLADYAGEYISLRSNFSTFERLAILVNNVTISVQDDELLVIGRSANRWRATASDRFTARYSDRTMVFERNGSGEVGHVLIGSPLGTYKRVRGLDAPGNIRLLVAFAVMVALLAVIGYGYRAFRRVPVQKRLPARDVFVGWFYALALVGLNVQLVLTLTGNTDKFSFGVPLATHINLLLINVNMLIGVTVIVFAIRQWATGIGSVAARFRYSILAMAAVVYLWIAYYFNFFAYMFA
jgi:CubicO group peptidase (beta-lactamase class C family)